MLQEALSALTVENIKIPFLEGTKFANYSLTYTLSEQPERVGIVWAEDQNMTTFFHIMEACRKAVERNLCQNLYLVRESKIGSPNNKGYKVYAQLFNNSLRCQINPKVTSVQYLAAYYELVKAAREGDLDINGNHISVKKLRQLTYESEILHDCYLLQRIKVVSTANSEVIETNFQVVKEFLSNLVVSQQLLGKETLILNTISYFPHLNKAQVSQLIEQLRQEKKIDILGAPNKPQEQLVCLVVKAN